MIVKNKLEKAFGPFGSSTGFFMFIGGIIALYFSLLGLIIALVGAFVSFTSTSTLIDMENKRIKFSNNLFGIIPAGKWIDIKSGMKLGLKKQHRGYQGYIRGTQPVSIHIRDIRIFLYGPDNKQIMPVKKFESFESANKELRELSTALGVELIS